jgi:DNA polymerase III epsilon subunit-like protein
MGESAESFLVIDTETTGLFDFARPADAEGQPRLASIAMLFCDAEMNRPYEWFALIKPDGWTMPPQAEAINGLTNDRLTKEGIDASVALAIYSGAIHLGRTVVAYNAQYDTKIMRGTLRRAGLPDLYEMTHARCVMEACTDVCRIPSSRGRGYKWPKLAQAHAHLFGAAHDGAHGALDDARAALRIAQELQKRKIELPRKGAAARSYVG